MLVKITSKENFSLIWESATGPLNFFRSMTMYVHSSSSSCLMNFPLVITILDGFPASRV